MRDLHVALPDDVARMVDHLAQERHEARNAVIVRALEAFFEAERRKRMADEMMRYAQALGDDSGRFVKETRSHVAQRLLRETSW